MSRLNAPPPDPVRTRGPRERIIKHRKKRPLHPYTIRDLIFQRSQEDHVAHVGEGFHLVFYETDEGDGKSVKHHVDVIFIKAPDGSRRPATYADAIAIRDAEMTKFGYEKCWIYTRDEVNAHLIR